jgi:uncharacterized protein (TIGR02466 family)|tara:strand:+ start:203 stop:901 length:699 start_codon:yes stop_codon:yes gene_type:complete
LAQKIDLLKKFCTPIWIVRLEKMDELNQELLAYVYRMRKDDPKGVKRSNMLGWHSKDVDIQASKPHMKFFNKIAPCLERVTKDLNWNRQEYGYKITSTWAIINPKYACNQSHIHGNNLISAAYYVKFPKNAGSITFQDPRSSNLFYHSACQKLSPLNEQSLTVQPETSLLAMFPSYLWHWVEPNLSDEDRVILSFNVSQYDMETTKFNLKGEIIKADQQMNVGKRTDKKAHK